MVCGHFQLIEKYVLDSAEKKEGRRYIQASPVTHAVIDLCVSVCGWFFLQY